MTSELEKRFFDTFCVKKIEDGACDMDDECRNTDCNTCQRINKFNYPQITDRVLLELICIANKYYIDLEGTDIKTMKNSLLENFMFFKRDVNEDIRTLFGKE